MGARHRTGVAVSAGRSNEFYQRSIRGYLSEAPTLPFMDLLARRTLAGDERAKEELCAHLAGIAEALSGKYGRTAYSHGLERDDLRQEAMCAMLEALPRWRPERMAFRSYAYSCARFAVMDIINLSHTISINRVLAHNTAAARFNAADDHEARVKGLRTRARLTRKSAEAALAAMVKPSSMQAADRDDDPMARGWLAAIENDYEEVLIRYELHQAFRRARNMLSDRERRSLKLRFGLEAVGAAADGATFREIGEEMGLSNQRAKQMVDGALAKLRAVIGASSGASSGTSKGAA